MNLHSCYLASSLDPDGRFFKSLLIRNCTLFHVVCYIVDVRVTYIHFLKLASTINFLFSINVLFLKVEIKWFTLLLLFRDFNIYTKNNYDFTAVDHIHI